MFKISLLVYLSFFLSYLLLFQSNYLKTISVFINLLVKTSHKKKYYNIKIVLGDYMIKQIDYDTNIYNTIRKNIRKYLLEKGITSAELDEMVDLLHNFIRQIQSEKVAYNFSVDTLYRIAKALDVPIDF